MSSFDIERSLRSLYNKQCPGAAERNVAAFVEANRCTIQLVADIWQPMIDNQPTLKLLLTESGCSRDFFKAYAMCKDMADDIIAWLSKQEYRPGRIDITLPAPWSCEPYHLLQTLRYPKRVPLVKAPWLEDEACKKFFKAMSHSNTYDADSKDRFADPSLERRYSTWFINQVPTIRKWLDEILPSVKELQRDVAKNYSPFAFSSGAVSDACTNPFCKFFRAEHYYLIAHNKPDVEIHLDPVANRNCLEEHVSFLMDSNAHNDKPIYNDDGLFVGFDERKTSISVELVPRYVVKAMTVPKQINSLRVVCPEDSWHARIQSNLSKALRRFWKRKGLDRIFCQDDQEKNRAAAWEGSFLGDMATVDSTSASDTIFRDWIRIIDHPTLNYLMSYMPTHVQWGKRVVRMGMFGTMGSPLTFDVMQIMGYIDVRLSHVVYELGTCVDPSRFPAQYYINKVYIVGDDISVYAAWAATLLDIMYALHKIPNREKTFIEGYYKESCGAEFYMGIDISSVYYPRGLSVGADITECHWDGYKEQYVSPIISLVSHHNELLTKGYKESADVILTFIKGSIDLTVGLDVGHEYNNTLYGKSFSQVVDQDGQVTHQVILEVPRNGAQMLYSPVVQWRDTEPSKKCWCKDVPKAIFDVLEAAWKRELFHAKGNICYLGGVQVLMADNVNSVHKAPYVELQLTRHA